MGLIYISLYNLNRMNKGYISLVLFFIYICSWGKLLQVPIISNEEVIYLRTQQVLNMDSAFNKFGQLINVNKKEIYEIKDGKETDFPVCREQPPESVFKSTSYHSISDSVIKNRLVYNFQDIKYPRNLIDMAFHDNKLYYILSSGKLQAISISSDLRSLKRIAQSNITTDKISSGYITILPSAKFNDNTGYGIFVHQTFATLINLKTNEVSQIKQYEVKKKVQSVIALNNNLFAVAYGKQGMKIFEINFSDLTLNVKYEFTRSNSNDLPINIKDIAYDKSRRILFILDYNVGLIPLKLDFSNQTLQVTAISSIIKNSFCDLLHYDAFNDDLYINCRQLHKYRINNWPITDEKILPKLEISIRQIVSTSKLTAFVGRDIFQIIYSERKTAIYQDQLLDKFIIREDMFISGNQNGILVGFYDLTPPSLICSTQNNTNIGSHRIVMKAVAQCNPQYFQTIGFQPGTVAPEDKCVYAIYQNLSIWTPAKLNTNSYLAIAIVIGLIGFAVLVWWGFSYLNLRNLQNYFDNYQNLQEDKGSEREQNQNKSIQIQRKESGGTEQKFEQKEQPVEMQDENIHDIE